MHKHSGSELAMELAPLAGIPLARSKAEEATEAKEEVDKRFDSVSGSNGCGRRAASGNMKSGAGLGRELCKPLSNVGVVSRST